MKDINIIKLTSYEVNALSVVIQNRDVLPRNFLLDFLANDDDISFKCHMIALAMLMPNHFTPKLQPEQERILKAYESWNKSLRGSGSTPCAVL